MINRDSFVKIMKVLDEYYNGDTKDALDTLGIHECVLHDHMDAITNALDEDVDPLKLATKDVHTASSGSYIYEWLFETSDFNEMCKDEVSLYDYICSVYTEHNEKLKQKRVNTIKKIVKKSNNTKLY